MLSSSHDFDEYITISKFEELLLSNGVEKSMRIIETSFPKLHGNLRQYFTEKPPVKLPALLKSVT
jgi:hypothetical protein